MSGESIDENIATALLRRLFNENIKAIPCPSALLLWSPSVDLCVETNPYIIDRHRNFNTDYIIGLALVWALDNTFPNLCKQILSSSVSYDILSLPKRRFGSSWAE